MPDPQPPADDPGVPAGAGPDDAGPDDAGPDDDAYDDALAALAGTGPEFGSHGLSNHGPMVAEALVQLGRPDAVAPWLARYRRRLEPGPPAGRPLSGEEWGAALADRRRLGDWVATFERAMADGTVADVLGQWLPRLAPGLVAGASHGLIRTAHATRALARADRPGRRAELAQGLAYWATAYQELPGPPLLIGPLDVAEALGAVPPLPAEAPEEDSIGAQLAHLDMIATPFEQAVAALGPPERLLDALDALAVGGAAAYLANVGAGHGIALVHAVTAPMALELLIPALGPEDGATAFAYAWQAVAALHAAFAPARPGADRTEVEDLARSLDPASLVAAAVDSGDEHAIKFTEAALRAHGRTPAPELLAGPADAASRFAVS